MKETLMRFLKEEKFDYGFKFVFPDGSVYETEQKPHVFTIKLNNSRSLDALFARGTMGFGEAYMAGDIDIEGDLQEVSRLGFQLQDTGWEPKFWEKVRIAYRVFTRKNTLEGSQKNIAEHYDLGNDFYSLWLDEKMQYTCAYFQSFEDSLEDAQTQKLDLVCQKLELKPGETLVEAGCGWGGLGLYAAQNYGVKVRSFNISKEQVQFARERAKSKGVGENQVEYVLDDYRNIRDGKTKYDKFVSVGMFEHVGKENYMTLYSVLNSALKENGLALVHSISRIHPSPMDPWLEKYIFPGAYIPSLAEMVNPIEKQNQELFVQDVENLRIHYALTLDHWYERLVKNEEKIRKEYGEAFLRMFKLYLRASAAGFRYGGILLYQLLIQKGYPERPKLTRHHFLGLENPKEKEFAGAN